MPHPIILVFLYLLTAILLTLSNWDGILFIFLALFPPFFLIDFKKFIKIIWKLRFFWFSIIFFYFYLTPGIPLWQGILSPSQQGFFSGLQQLSKLWLMLIALQILLQKIEKKQFISTLYWYLHPLQLFKIPIHSIAIRMLLILEIIPQLQAQLQQKIEYDQNCNNKWQCLENKITAWIKKLFFFHLKKPATSIKFIPITNPSPWQWFYPIIFIILYNLFIRII